MRAALTAGALTAGAFLLAACAGPAPYSGAGSADDGFGSFSSYELERAQREAALTGAAPGGYAGYSAPVPVAAAPLATPTAPSVPGGISTSELAAAGIGGGAAVPGTLPATVPATQTVAPVIGGGLVAAAPSAAATIGTPVAAPVTPVGSTPVPVLPQGGVVAAAPVAAAAPLPEWSAEADPLRSSGLEASPANAAPQIVAATGGVVAPGSTGPNIVDYALAAPNSVGQEYYSRFRFAGQGRAARNCAGYASPDEAQRDFLARGGPDRDARGLDPDGDGFACSWDPAPFRAAVGR